MRPPLAAVTPLNLRVIFLFRALRNRIKHGPALDSAPHFQRPICSNKLADKGANLMALKATLQEVSLKDFDLTQLPLIDKLRKQHFATGTAVCS